MKTQQIRFLFRYLIFGLLSLLSVLVVRADKIAAGKDFAGAIDAGGILRTWGNNSIGQLGHSSGVAVVATPTKVSATVTYAAVAMGQDFTLAIDTAGVVWAWGNNASGQLGCGSSTTLSSATPVKVGLPAGTTATAVIAGLSHGIALLSDGRVYIWGSNGSGQLGHNDTITHYTPVAIYDGAGVSTSNWRYSAIGATDLSSFFIKTDGTLWACGSDARGELGTGKASVATSPFFRNNLAQIGISSSWTKVVGGAYHVLGLQGSALYVWGDNAEGQMGNGTYLNTTMSPTRLAADKTWAVIGTGRYSFSSYAATTTGALYAWGGNINGQLDLPVSYATASSLYIMTPTLLGNGPAGWTAPWQGIAAGSNFALFSDNGIPQLVYTVGDNTIGQLGNGVIDSTVNTSPAFVTAKISLNDIEIAAPSLTSTVLGANTTISSLLMTVTNNNSANIVAGSLVRLYLSANSNLYPNSDGVVDTSAILLGSTTISSLAGNTSTTVTLTNLQIPDSQGAYYLIADVGLPNGLTDVDTSNNTVSTAVTLQRPKLALGHLQGLANSTTIDVPTPAFTGVQFDLTNTATMGMVPNGKVITYEVYLYYGSSLSNFDPLNIPSSVPLVASGTYSGGLAPQASTTLGSPATLTINIPSTAVAGDYYLIFLANRNRNLSESDSLIAQLTQKISLTSTADPRLGLDYGNVIMSSSPSGKQWIRVTDVYASGSEAWQTPKLVQGESASLTLTVNGPTTVNAPWLIVGSASAPQDQVTYSLDNVLQSSLTGYHPSYASNSITIPAGAHTVTWTYTQNSVVTANTTYARLDLDLPSFISTSTAGAGTWKSYADPTAPAIASGTVARSPTITQGQYAALSTSVTGPAVVQFWWKAQSVASVPASTSAPAVSGDTLTFAIDGAQANLITTKYSDVASPAVISGLTGWQQVAFLIPGGVHALSWSYNQNSSTISSGVYVTGLQVLNPIPTSLAPNVVTNSADYPGVPPNTVDLAIGQVIATPSTYILNDANGTGRLPITIRMVNLGSTYTPATSISSTNLDIRLSKTGVFDAPDNIRLGDFAKIGISSTGTSNSLPNGGVVVFDAELNLPFDIPTDNYYLMVRCSTGQLESVNPEFTLANNTWVSSTNGFFVERLPDLQIANQHDLSSTYPYHPEDPVDISYDVVNKGLADMLATQPFQIQVRLRAHGVAAGRNLLADKIIKTYPPITESQFLPAAGPQYPNGGVMNIIHYMDFPTLRDMLVAISSIDAGTPEDDSRVYAHMNDLRSYKYYFDIFVDSANQIAESSETNLFALGSDFSVVPVGYMQGFGDLVGDPVTGFNNVNSVTYTGTSFTGITANDILFQQAVQEYAFGLSPAGSPGLLYDFMNANGQPSVVVPPNLADNYLALTFDFNVRAYDVEIDVKCSPDLATWTTVKTLKPPYYGTSGPQALTGYGSLKDDPYVLSVDGNSTDVQKVYIARVTVRDMLPLSSGPSRFMKLVVRPKPGLTTAPIAPTITTCTQVISADPLKPSGVYLDWTPTLPIISNPFPAGTLPSPYDGSTIMAGSYIIERAQGSPVPLGYEVLATYNPGPGGLVLGFVEYADTTAVSGSTYKYRIRVTNAAGSSVYSNESVISYK